MFVLTKEQIFGAIESKNQDLRLNITYPPKISQRICVIDIIRDALEIIQNQCCSIKETSQKYDLNLANSARLIKSC